MSAPTQLYRAFDANGALLYVGISINALNRLQSHRRDAPWFPECINVKVEHFADRSSARKAEITAIKTERPLFNVQHQSPPDERDADTDPSGDAATSGTATRTTLLRLPEILTITGLTRSALYRLLDEDDFPRPAKLGSRINVWPSHEIQAWIRGRIEQRDHDFAGPQR